MSGLGDVAFRRVTVDSLKKSLGARQDVPYVGLVTLTSVATEIEAVSPGALFVPGVAQNNTDAIRKAIAQGAYAVLLPEGSDKALTTAHLGIPVLTARNIDERLGKIAAYMEADPSDSLAVFVTSGEFASRGAAKLATLLHMLGNPVGIISKEKTASLNRGMNLHFPLTSVELQHAQAVMLEDGAAAVVIAADADTLDDHALVGTHIDVISTEEPAGKSFGAVVDSQTHNVKPGMFSTQLAQLGTKIALNDAPTVMSVAMALAAGITTESIEQTVQVTEEFS